jgi:hypothetical protein
LETGVLWATYTQTLNDSSEVEYGQKVVEDYVASFPDQDATRRLGVAMEFSPQRTFACCFCERSKFFKHVDCLRTAWGRLLP